LIKWPTSNSQPIKVEREDLDVVDVEVVEAVEDAVDVVAVVVDVLAEEERKRAVDGPQSPNWDVSSTKS
jgi:hypothetical protein